MNILSRQIFKRVIFLKKNPNSKSIFGIWIFFEFYSFTFSNEDFTLNPIYNYALAIFESTKKFQEKTTDIAKHLYDMSIHPQIKSGDLFIAYFSKVCIDDEVTDAIGIFKSENRQAFLKLNQAENEFALHYDKVDWFFHVILLNICGFSSTS